MICPRCNVEQGDNKFCNNCGNEMNITNKNINNVGNVNEVVTAKKVSDVSKTNLFFIRMFFSLSLSNMMIAGYPATLAVIGLSMLPIILIFGLDGSFLKSILSYIPYVSISTIMFVISLVIYLKNRCSMKGNLLCPNCERNLSNWGYCPNCKVKYDVDVIKANNKNVKSPSGLVTFFYVLAIINICILCFELARLSIIIFHLNSSFESIFWIVLPRFIYAVVSFTLLFVMIDLRVKRN